MSQKKLRNNKSPGWAAFDLKQKQGPKSVFESEPFPPISSTSTSTNTKISTNTNTKTSSAFPLLDQELFLKNDSLLVRPFSSVLLPSKNFPTLTTTSNKDFERPVQSSNLIEEKNLSNNVVVDEVYEQLKRLHSWADKSLIEDIMAAVSNDFDKASTLLKEMVSVSIDDNNDDEEEEVEASSIGERLHLHDSGDMELILADLRRLIPIEPEWEEDDIYSIQRKDAVKMMRSASRHSKAANDAYLRGDHLSAQQFSVSAKEEWKAAERLNANAAKEILSIRNSKNDIWTLDLHGLHAAEAIEALKEHLKKVEESQGSLNRFSSLNNNIYSNNNNTLINSGGGIAHSEPIQSSNHIDKFGKQQPLLSRQRPTSLQVITGKGNHSRGQASLPVAIERFLSENRYHYDERRPGVIVVRPKFRQPA